MELPKKLFVITLLLFMAQVWLEKVRKGGGLGNCGEGQGVIYVQLVGLFCEEQNSAQRLFCEE